MKVKDCMCNQVTYVTPESTVKDCAKLMCNKHVGCIPVCDNNNNVVGLVTDRDIILRSIACDKDTNQIPVSEVMTCNVFCCKPEDEIYEAENIMSTNQVRRLPVIENNKIVGIITLGDLTKNQNVSTEGVCNTLENICNCDEKNAE